MIDTGRIPLVGETLAWYRQGLAAATGGHFERAAAFYNQVIAIRPDFWEAWYERGLVLEDLGLYAAALASYDHALALEPARDACGEIHFHQAQVYQYGLGDYNAALAEYDRVLQLRPQHVQALLHRGNVWLYGLKQPQMAIDSYDQALSYQTDLSEAWRNRGSALVELAQHQLALISYDRALLLNPNDEMAEQGRKLARNFCNLSGGGETTTNIAAMHHVAFDSSLADPSLMDPLPSPTVRRSADGPGRAGGAVTPLRQPILVIEDDQGSREVYLFQRQYTIGRDPHNDIHLHSRFISRFHAVFQRIDDPDGQQYSYQVQDGDLAGKPSTNGMQVNGKPQQVRALQSGDVVSFGPQSQATYWLR
jgi:tetratricopeptide (TPR) repeat protein